MSEEHQNTRVLRQPLEVHAKVFENSEGRWGAREGTVLWYATEKSKPNTEISLCASIDTGETRPTYDGIVEWLETKARRFVKEAFDLEEERSSQLVIKSEINLDP